MTERKKPTIAELEGILDGPAGKICINHDGSITTQPEVICICGSTRFIDQHAIARWEFEKTGEAICLMVNYLPAWYAEEQGWNGQDHFAEQAGVKKIQDQLHFAKIDLADRVYVVNVGGYIGESTRNEIAYAEQTGTPVEYMEPPQAAGEK